jgi:SAM-dependent methyltransferase
MKDRPRSAAKVSKATVNETAVGDNAEATEAWDGPLFDRFSTFREVVTTGLANHGDAALEIYPPPPGARVLDVGCGFGDATQRIAEIVGPEGSAVGVDVAPRFIEGCRSEAAEAGVENASFEVVDVQTGDLGGVYDYVFSRFGVMFFAGPVPAFRNIRAAMVPGGRLVVVVWRRREDNDWMYRAQQIVEGIVERPTEYDDPTCGPGPFSMAGADTTSDILLGAGFERIRFDRVELPIVVGYSVDEAVELAMAIGPGGEIIRLLGDRAADRIDEITSALREGLSEFEGDDGVITAPASTWVVTATAPG